MSYLILSIIVIGISFIYEHLHNIRNTNKGVKLFVLSLLCLALCGFAGLRTKYNDTGNYVVDFLTNSSEFSAIFKGSFSFGKVYLFEVWKYLIYNFISESANIYLFLCSVVFVVPSVVLIAKYSRNFLFSMFLFVFGGGYLFSLAGIKQAMATGIVLMGLSALLHKKYFKYYFCCFLAVGFHAYSFLFFILPILGTKALNKRTVVFCLGIILIGISMSYFSGAIASVVEFLGKNTAEEDITKGKVNILRAVVYFIPLILTVFGNRKIDNTCTEQEKVLIKISLLASVFMVLAMFGNPILFGRIPQYFDMGIVVSMPLLINSTFKKEETKFVIVIAVILYFIFGVYELYNDGAFVKDIFGLIWF